MTRVESECGAEQLSVSQALRGRSGRQMGNDRKAQFLEGLSVLFKRLGFYPLGSGNHQIALAERVM